MDIGIVIDIFVVDGGWLSGLSGWSEVLIPGGGRGSNTWTSGETCFCSDPSARFCTAVHRAQPVPVRCALQCTHGEQFGECALV